MLPPILVIPAYNPDTRLIQLVDTHQKNYPEQACVVINDGSAPEYGVIFKRLEAKGIIVLHHATNGGKGEALKTGMHYVMQQGGDAVGMVSADADGQHAVTDIINISKAMLADSEKFHIGVRVFNDPSIPLRSRIGNKFTRMLFNSLTKSRIKDTQTGLRGIPIALIKAMMHSKLSGYEFEFEMLFMARQLHIAIVQMPIETIYIDQNKSSHFKPLLDSMKIYHVFLRYCGVALSSFAIDYSLFCLVFFETHNMKKAVIMARLVSSTVNFFLNKNITFKHQSHMAWVAVQFVLLALCIGVLSYQLLVLISLSHLNVYVSKVLAEGSLFLISFAVQHLIVFAKTNIQTQK